jgi:hypothetical protein
MNTKNEWPVWNNVELVTANSVEQGPLWGHSRTIRHDVRHILWNPKVNYLIYKSLQ